MREKRCPACGENKSLEEFGKDGDGHQGYCRVCQRRKVLANYNRLKVERPEGFPPVAEKGCSGCFKVKPGSEFYTQKWDTTGLSSRCKVCTRGATMKKKYGIDPEDYETMLLSQGGNCAICRMEPSGGKYLAVDHCHNSLKVRGLLCVSCNTALGKFPTVEILERAIAYLRNSTDESLLSLGDGGRPL